MNDANGYNIGYGRPPLATRFRKGRSGNPTGRPRKIPDLASDLGRELTRTTEVMIKGQPRRVSRQRALVRTLVNEGLEGNLAALQLALTLSRQIFGAMAQNKIESDIDAGIEGVIEAEVQRRLGELQNGAVIDVEVVEVDD